MRYKHPNVAWLRDNARFLMHFVRHPRSTGAVAPSSKWLAERMVDGMGLANARTVVEIGPGTGAFTSHILREIGPSTRFLAVELDGEFARDLARRYPRVEVIHDSAENLGRHLNGRGPADSVLSSLPWAAFPADLQRRLLRSIVECVRPGGLFATFAYIHSAWLPVGRRFRAMLAEHFRDVRSTRVVWRNLPPAFVYRCEK
jgi:phospholipid N-methyltransferase